MANQIAAIKQIEIQRFLKAGRASGFEKCKITVYPDGRKEYSASLDANSANSQPENSWDKILK